MNRTIVIILLATVITSGACTTKSGKASDDSKTAKREMVPAQLRASEPLVTDMATSNGFPLVKDGVAADIAYDIDDANVVRISASLFADDIEKVTGIKAYVRPSNVKTRGAANAVVYAGTLGQSSQLDAILKAKKIDTSAIKGKWESYLIVSVDAPEPGVDRGLLIIGSDRRGGAPGGFRERAIGEIGPVAAALGG